MNEVDLEPRKGSHVKAPLFVVSSAHYFLFLRVPDPQRWE